MILIYYEFENLDLLQRVVSKEVKKLHEWLGVDKLELMIDKINCTILKSPLNFCPITVNNKIGNFPIRKTCHVKFYGALLNENLTEGVLDRSFKKTG